MKLYYTVMSVAVEPNNNPRHSAVLWLQSAASAVHGTWRKRHQAEHHGPRVRITFHFSAQHQPRQRQTALLGAAKRWCSSSWRDWESGGTSEAPGPRCLTQDHAMASTASETTPLMAGSSSTPPPRPQRTVTFNPTVQTSPVQGSAAAKKPSAQLPPIVPGSGASAPVLSDLKSKLRRRHSAATPTIPPLPQPKIGPQRSTKNVQKLKLLPDPEQGEDDEESGRDVYVQYTRIKDPNARRDAARLGKEDRDRLPRVTAFCTASSYRMEDLFRYLKGKSKVRGANPKMFDECLYTPYDYGRGLEKIGHHRSSHGSYASEPLVSDRTTSTPAQPERRYSDSALEVDGETHTARDELIDLHTDTAGEIALETGEDQLVVPTHGPEDQYFLSARRDSVDFDTTVHIPEAFLFNYGTVVLWGFNVKEEQRFLKEISRFENEKLAKDDVQSEDFNFYYTQEYQARIYNDFISLRDKKNYMIKLAISHALSQSVKVRGHLRRLLVCHVDISLDFFIRGSRRRHHRNDERNPDADRHDRQSEDDANRDQHADRRAVHTAHQHPLARLCARRT